ncbi:MAG: HDOD domain-containing protein, partial [Gammaproteobacteria bacterium]|nr:HDOD domain-containing protein [Gammaproteobacteria bacterium]
MPDVSPSGLEVMEILRDESFDILKLSKAISHDPVLSSTVLKYANAPIYRNLVEVTNVRQAISILGSKNVRMAVVVATMRHFDREPSELAQTFWDHSFDIATLCRLIARKVALRLVEDIELTGLLHEMGSLVLITNFKDQYQ